MCCADSTDSSLSSVEGTWTVLAADTSLKPMGLMVVTSAVIQRLQVKQDGSHRMQTLIVCRPRGSICSPSLAS